MSNTTEDFVRILRDVAKQFADTHHKTFTGEEIAGVLRAAAVDLEETDQQPKTPTDEGDGRTEAEDGEDQ